MRVAAKLKMGVVGLFKRRITKIDMVIIDPWPDKPINESDYPEALSRYISAIDKHRYMVTEILDNKLYVCKKTLKRGAKWSEPFKITRREWEALKMKEVVFTDGQELIPLIKMNNDEMWNPRGC